MYSLLMLLLLLMLFLLLVATDVRLGVLIVDVGVIAADVVRLKIIKTIICSVVRSIVRVRST